MSSTASRHSGFSSSCNINRPFTQRVVSGCQVSTPNEGAPRKAAWNTGVLSERVWVMAALLAETRIGACAAPWSRPRSAFYTKRYYSDVDKINQIK